MSEPTPVQRANEVGPKDSGEIYDYVRRMEPISFREIREDTHWMAPDDIFSCLDAMERAGLVESIPGDIEEHGTTRDLWVVCDE